MPRVISRSSVPQPIPELRLPARMALWLLARPRLGHSTSVKRIAGRLLKQPALQGVVQAQSRLGQMLCHDCGNVRDRRMGLELLRQASRAGDVTAQLELARVYLKPRCYEPKQARILLEQAAAQGSVEAQQMLNQL